MLVSTRGDRTTPARTYHWCEQPVRAQTRTLGAAGSLRTALRSSPVLELGGASALSQRGTELRRQVNHAGGGRFPFKYVNTLDYIASSIEGSAAQSTKNSVYLK